MNADIRDTMEYMVNSGDELIDEVIEERRLKRAKANILSERLLNESGMMQDDDWADNQMWITVIL